MPSFDITDGVALYYNDEGAGEPLVLLHGFPLTSELWKAQRAALSARYRVITPDLRGMGGSDLPAGESYTVDTYADDVVALLDYLGIGSAVVGGMSMGGYIVFALLRRHPDRVRGVILVDTKAGADTDEGRAGRRKMAEQARAEGAGAIADAMLPKMLTEQTRSEQRELTSFVREMMAGVSVDGIVAALGALAARPDSTPMLPSIAVPALVIVGGEDPITPPAEGKVLHAAIPDAELVVVDGGSHAAVVERPDEINAAIERWMERFG